MLKSVFAAFSPSAEFEHLPLFKVIMNAIDCIYIPRGGNEESKIKALEKIKDRQELIEKTGKYK